ncbi:MAG: sigma-70 family RNA polymerase sigma factor [Verrucomicrobiota bacterium]
MSSPLSKPEPDAELVRAAQAGELAAFDALVDRYERQVYSNAFRILRHQEDAEDVTQQTFLSAMQHLADFRGDAAFETWLLRICTHAALKIIRRRKTISFTSLEASTEADEHLGNVPHPEFIADWRESPGRLVERADIQRLLDETLAQLDEKHRLVFLLRDVQQLTIKETAQTLGLTEANTKVRLLRARLQLREVLTRALGDETRRLQPHDHRAPPL